MQKVVNVKVIWIQVKNYFFREYWMRKYSDCMDKLPRWRNMRQTIYTTTNAPVEFRKEAELMPPSYKLPPATKYSILYDDDDDYKYVVTNQCALLPYLPVAGRHLASLTWPNG